MTETTDAQLEDAPLLPVDRGRCPFDPPPEYARWREEQPMRRITLQGGRTTWLATRHADVRAVLGDLRFSNNRDLPGYPNFRSDEPPVYIGNFLSTDPPRHTEIRRMLTKTFTLRNAELKRPGFQRIIDGLLDRMADQPRPVDLIEHFALPLPSVVICELFGVPYADREVFQRNALRMFDLTSSGEEVIAARDAIDSYMRDLLQEKDRNPADDLFTELAINRIRTGELSVAEAAGMGILMLIGGHETITNMIALSTLVLLEHPDQLARMLAEPEIVPSAVEELLRFLTIVHNDASRLAMEDVEIGGVTVKAGEGVMVSLPSANRDADAFTDPDRLDLARGARHHVAFSFGIHQCLGQSIARAELQLALPSLFRRFPGLRVTTPLEEIPFQNNTILYGMPELPVTW